MLAEQVFSIVTGSNSNRTDAVFDAYRDVSLKNAERPKQNSNQGGMKYKNILTSFQLKPCCEFLSVSSNKTEVYRIRVEGTRIYIQVREQTAVCDTWGRLLETRIDRN